MNTLNSAVVFLGAAVVAVPIFNSLRIGSILGYLVAGAVIGPALLNLVSDPGTILHFAELGVVLLLFLIGIELAPQKLWRLRNSILFCGGGQLLISATLVGLAVYALTTTVSTALIIGLALALSSTAFAIQLMQEHRMLKSPPGQQGFSILLMQDLAVIPVLLMVEALADKGAASGPAWYVGVGAIALVLVIGRFLLNPFLALMSRYGSEEIMTASALLIVISTALGMQMAGLSMGMGAFVAGVLLANSRFRHQIESEIEPFKGLLLGLFFMAIGMNLDLGLLTREPLFIVSAAVALVATKTAIIWALLRISGQESRDALRVGLMLSQGGEFAFVVMTAAVGNALIEPTMADQVTLIVGLSMALTAPLVILHSQFFASDNCPPVYDESSDQDEPEVIIAGFGRFGQISGRILSANGIPFTALDNDAKHIEFIEKFGNRVFYGDGSKLDLLKAAGIDHARVFLIALDDEEQALRVAQLVRGNYPDLRIVARAHNRFSVRLFRDLGVHTIIREMSAGSLEAADELLQAYGFTAYDAHRMVDIFARYDEESLENSLAMEGDMDALIDHSLYSRDHLAGLFKNDKSELPEAPG
ncbi:MAG: monovalent cation:proton antiporter-2 (CPA2) family protein [Halioglobus sp.]